METYLNRTRAGADGPSNITHQFLGMPAVIRSPAMEQLLLQVQRVARTNASVLITGETGSGKELIARAVHHYSNRQSKPWVDVNCGAIPAHLLESELFGYEKGAFSGADSAKPGLFELADGGTLFLDEIGELDRNLQVKLLRALDGSAYYRLGGVRKVSVNIRVLSATNVDMREAVKDGRLRADLYHRLSQIQLRVPPLRERPEDILALAQLFAREQNAELHLTPEALDALRRHSWPGNVRELRNVISHSFVFATGPCVGLADLGLALENPQSGSPAAPAQTLNLKQHERGMVFKALAESGGHHGNAAKLLGISGRSLSRKLKFYGGAAVAHDLAV